MTERPNITRRDFMNGVALSLAAGTSLSPLEILAMQGEGQAGYYPPGLTGLRGSHVGSFEVAHAVSRTGTRFPIPDSLIDDPYDLVVVGGGISGLAAAKFFRDRTDHAVRILVLDNHDDFGGHAKRNEFNVDGRTLVGYGGSQTLDNPRRYSRVSAQLLKDVGIDTDRFYDFYDQEFLERHGLGEALFFDQATYGVDRVLPSPLGGFLGEPDERALSVGNIRQMPVSREAQDAFLMLMQGGVDHLEGKSLDERIQILRGITYEQFLQQYAGVPPDLTDILRDQITPIWGVGWDSLSALVAAGYEHPGTWELGIEPESLLGGEEPYIHHFPDGNAGVARALLRNLVPTALPGRTMESLATTRAIYAELDHAQKSVRIRLESTAVDVRHTPDDKGVDVTYIRDGDAHRVRGKHVVLACYNNIIPYICAEIPEKQVEAIRFASKVPLVIGNVAIRNWRAFRNLGFSNFYSPGGVLFKQMGLDFPVSMGNYRFSAGPDEPIVVQGWHSANVPGKGLSAREQHDAGRHMLYERSYDEFESSIYGQFDGMLGDGGFDAERDIAAITVNRWPHGYAYEYNDFDDPPDWGPDKGPHIEGRTRIGRISIANSDSSAYAYVNGAIDAADRAVNEQVAVS